MKQTLRILFIIPILLCILFSGCGEREDEPLQDVSDTLDVYDEARLPETEAVEYRNPALGFAVKGKTEWQLSESSERRDGMNLVLLTLVTDDHQIDLRVVNKDWRDIKPLVRLDQQARDDEEEINIDGVRGTRTHLQRFGNDYVRMEKNNIIFEITGKPEGVDAVLAELIWFDPITDEPERVTMERVSRNELPEEVQKWVDNCYSLDMAPFADSMVFESKTYIFATWGSRPTGGYSVRIQEAIVEGDELRVPIEYTRPRPGEMVTQAFTHPVDLTVVDGAFEKVRFETSRTGAPRAISHLRGLDALRDIKAGSTSIKIFSPVPDSEVSDPVKVTGVANVHEANVEYRVLDETGEKVKEGFTTAASAQAWGYYEFEVLLGDEVQSGSRFTIELFYTDAKDGEERDVVSLPLRLK